MDMYVYTILDFLNEDNSKIQKRNIQNMVKYHKNPFLLNTTAWTDIIALQRHTKAYFIFGFCLHSQFIKILFFTVAPNRIQNITNFVNSLN